MSFLVYGHNYKHENTHLIELATRTHSRFISLIEYDTMLSADNVSISKGLLHAHLLPCHFQIRSTLIYLKSSYVVPLDNREVLFNSMPQWIQPPDKLSQQYHKKTHTGLYSHRR